MPSEIVVISSGSTWKDKTRTMLSNFDAMFSIIGCDTQISIQRGDLGVRWIVLTRKRAQEA